MKSPAARKHLIENGAKRKDVGTVIDGLATDLLRRHVAYCAHNDARIGIDTSRGNVCLRLTAVRLSEFRNAEVENFYAAIIGDEDVVGFQIAMNDSFLMCGGKPVRDLARVLNHSALRQRRAP